MPLYQSTFVMALAATALAQTSLYIPGFDPQAISADVEGVDAQGRTTWLLHGGAPSGTFTDPGDVFPATATLVEDASEAHLTLVFDSVTVGADCSISGNVAVCSAIESGTPVTETETFTPIEVQAGTTAALAATTSVPNSGGSNSGGAGTTAAPSNSQQTKSTPSPTQTTSTKATSNGARALAPYIGLFAIIPAMTVFL